MNDNEILDISSIVFVNKEKDLDQERKVLGTLFAQQPWCFDSDPGSNPSLRAEKRSRRSSRTADIFSQCRDRDFFLDPIQFWAGSKPGPNRHQHEYAMRGFDP